MFAPLLDFFFVNGPLIHFSVCGVAVEDTGGTSCHSPVGPRIYNLLAHIAVHCNICPKFL